MGTTYEDKRAELKALASGGTAGRDAYREGRQRLVSDQRAAIDAALSGPVRFGADTASALESIVRPVGDTAMARMDFAGEQHGTSMGALDAALSGALSQQGGARTLNYNQTLSDARTSTDRTIEAGEIQRRKAAERAAAAEAERAATESELTQGQKEDRAWGAAQLRRDQEVAEKAAQNARGLYMEMLKAANVAGTQGDPLLAQATIENMLKAKDAMERAEALAESAKLGTKIESFERFGHATQTPEEAAAVYASTHGGRLPPTMGRSDAAPVPEAPAANDAIDLALRKYLEPAESIFADNNVYLNNLRSGMYDSDLAATAYADAGYGPYEEGLGIFRHNPSAIMGDLNAQASLDILAETGMLPKEYAAWEREQASEGAIEAKMATAVALGINPGLIDKAASGFPVPEALWANLDAGTAGADVVSQTLTMAMERIEAGEDVAEVVDQAAITVRDNAEAEGVDPLYADALAAIVREQLDVYAKRYGAD